MIHGDHKGFIKEQVCFGIGMCWKNGRGININFLKFNSFCEYGSIIMVDRST